MALAPEAPEVAAGTTLTGCDINEADMRTKIINKSTTINFTQGDTQGSVHDDILASGTFRLSPGIIVYESNPISKESRIFRAKLMNQVVGDRDIAVKLLPVGEREKREAKTHISVPYHRNIVERIFTDIFNYRGQSTIYIAMERCDDLNMSRFVKSQVKNRVTFDANLYMSYAQQVAEGLAFLHSHNVINRDLKPPNLLLAEDRTVVKIAEFGMCKEIKPGLDDVTRTIESLGTIGWSAPEILNGDERIGLESDIFLLGLVFYFLWSYGKHPFGDDPHSWNHYIKHNENLNLNGMLIHDKAAGNELVRSMLDPDPTKRPSADKILNHKIFEGIECANNSVCADGPSIMRTRSQEEKTLRIQRANVRRKERQSLIVAADSAKEKLLPRSQSMSTPITTKAKPPFYVVALYNFDATRNDELSFRKGERLIVTGMPERGWWKLQSQRTKKTALGPSNFLACEEWYAGDISKTEAARLLLKNENKTGTFLVRETRMLKTFELSLLVNVRVAHHMVYANVGDKKDGFSFAGGEPFHNLCEMIDHYKNNRGLLEHKLVHPYKPKRPSLEVDHTSVTLQTVIHIGVLATVWKGRWNDKEVAVKAYHKGMRTTARCFNEAEVMKHFRHSKLLPLLAEVTCEPVYIVTELMPLGNLRNYLIQGKEQIFSDKQANMAIQITSGMQYIEMMKYVHLDLRAVNILVGNGETYKIAGFDLCRPEGQAVNKSVGYAQKWTAIEVMENLPPTSKADVWSFGVLLYEIVTFGKVPYPDVSDFEIADLLNRGHRMAKPAECTDKYYDVMVRCWQADPPSRPSFKDLHKEFLTGKFSWNPF